MEHQQYRGKDRWAQARSRHTHTPHKRTNITGKADGSRDGAHKVNVEARQQHAYIHARRGWGREGNNQGEEMGAIDSPHRHGVTQLHAREVEKGKPEHECRHSKKQEHPRR